jgi:hypothetical protein
VAFSADGRWLAVTGNRVRLYRVADLAGGSAP